MATAIALQNPFIQIPRVPSPGDIYKDSGCLLFFFHFLEQTKVNMLLESRLRLLGIHRECVFFLFSPLLLTLVAFK